MEMVIGLVAEEYRILGIVLAALLGGGIMRVYVAGAEKEHLKAENTQLVIDTFERALIEARRQIGQLQVSVDECNHDRKVLHKELTALRREVALLRDSIDGGERPGAS